MIIKKTRRKRTEEENLKHSIKMKELHASGVNFRKGKVHSEEAKKIMSEIKKKNPINYWTNKKRLDISGENHYNWKGGSTDKNKAIRNSTEYKNWRKSVFIRDNYTCTICGQIGKKLNADHIKPFSTHIELRLDLNNGRTLCYECHKKTDTYCRKAKKVNL